MKRRECRDRELLDDAVFEVIVDSAVLLNKQVTKGFILAL